MKEDLDKAPMITGTVHNHGISTKIITIKMAKAWALVTLAILTQDSRQDTIKVIMVISMIIVATTTAVAAVAVVDSMAVMVEAATTNMVAL
jgi:hypothetical protein